MKHIFFGLILLNCSIIYSKASSLKQVFTNIYNEKLWAGYPETSSGSGSMLHETQRLISELEKIITDLQIKSILDLPCGDFNWMKHVTLATVNSYIGADIVSDLIDSNNSLYSSPQKSFIQLDLTQDDLPQVDLILCRDCFLHLKYEHIFAALFHIKKSKSKYALLSTRPNTISNKNITSVTQKFRPLNLQISPFHLPDPILLIDEGAHGKYMGLWRVSDLPDFLDER